MTTNARAGTRILGSLRLADDTGIVRMESRFDTDIDDLWSALTDPRRLVRWIAEVEGDLSLGGEFRARFTSGWEGTGRVEACEPPRRLLVLTRDADEPDEEVLETGTLAVGLALRGFEVTASDASPEMVGANEALAAERGVALQTATRTWAELDGERFDAVLCVGNSLTHAGGRAGAGPRSTCVAGIRALRRAAHHLRNWRTRPAAATKSSSAWSPSSRN